MAQKWTTDKVRKAWLDFFNGYDHHILASASLVPNDDPSLLWINSGVATLKPYFDGRQTPVAKRLVNAQKAIRTNDIANIGITARHQTFFEMLGNFAIGDYFKEEAITWAWEFLTSSKWLHLDPQLLYVTVYHDDAETYNLWLKTIKVPASHIIKGTRTTNFWDMGQGPCGPNTEIYYDRGIKYDREGKGLSLLINDEENDRYIEIWNIVFSQFNNDGHNNYSDLPRKNIDTGAGLERLVAILQDVPTNFDTDLFQTIITACAKLTPYHYDINNYFTKEKQQQTINSAFKIIADHLRCLVFAISDGVFPSNKDRGYVLRRLLRRAVVYGQKLNINKPFLFQLVPVVITVMGNHYRELHGKEELITNIIQQEETKFWTTLQTGKQLLLTIINDRHAVSGEEAFKLFDTYGYPIELTLELAQEAKATVDVIEFEHLLTKSKAQTRAGRSNHQALNIQSSFLTNLKVPSTFVGYDEETIKTNIALLFNDDQEVTSLTDESGYIILTKTPFYAEKGGQAADDGIISSKTGIAQVLDVQQGPQKQHLHYVKVTGKLTKNELVNADINHLHRDQTRKNHSGTHLLHAALRKCLGLHVMQAGSFNNYQYLRLDFSHYQPVTKDEITQLEAQVAQWIKEKHRCEVIYCSYEAAMKMGALAFFGEKYDNEVRVVKFGDFSLELCGGTHCHNSQDVEQLLITNVEAKGSGAYRIHALTSYATINSFLQQQFATIMTQANKSYDQYANGKKAHSEPQITKLYEQLKSCAHTGEGWRQAKVLLGQLQALIKKWQLNIHEIKRHEQLQQYLHLQPQMRNNHHILITNFANLDIKTLRELVEHYRNQYQKIIIIFTNKISDNNYLLLVATSKDLHQERKYQSNILLQTLLQQYPGKGGGSPMLAQAKITSTIDSKAVLTLFMAL